MKGYSKIALHVCIEVFVESAHYQVYHLSNGANYNISETKEHIWWKDRSISLMKHWCLSIFETVMTSQHIGFNDNLEDNKKAIVERCKNLQSGILCNTHISSIMSYVATQLIFWHNIFQVVFITILSQFCFPCTQK